jgi:hypothetical protein
VKEWKKTESKESSELWSMRKKEHCMSYKKMSWPNGILMTDDDDDDDDDDGGGM